MTECNNLFKTVFLASILLFCISMAFAAMPEQYSKPAVSKTQALQEKRQQFEEEAADAIPAVEAEYAKFIHLINSHQTPDDANVSSGLKFIARNRKFLPVFTKQQKSNIYYTLSAWVYYFDKKPDKALRQVVSGYKLTPQDSKIVKTYLALSLIYRDYTPIAEILAGQLEPSPSAEEPQTQEDSPYREASNVELNLDTSKIHPELLGKTFNIQPGTSGQAQRHISCILLWKLDPNELEKFSSLDAAPPPPPPAPVPKPAPDQEQETESEPSPDQQTESESSTGQEESSEPTELQTPKPKKQKEAPSETNSPSLEAFSKLQSLFDKDAKAVFMGINFNDPSKAKNIENWLVKNPQKWQSIPPSAELQQKTTSFLNFAPEKPMLLIVGPDSAVRYLGNVDSFLPPMIISSILGDPQQFIEPNEPNEPNQPAAEPQTVIEKVAPAEPNKSLPPLKEPNEPPKPAVPKETIQNSEPAPQTPSPAAAKTEIDEEFFDPRAETLIENAKAFFKIANRLQYHTYAKPVEMCRTVIKDYPNTKYSEQARLLMRQVPERFRDKYNITDEELGL